MYKILGRRVAKNPCIARLESNKKERFNWIFILALKKNGAEINCYKKIIRDASRKQGEKIAIEMMRIIMPHYIAVARCNGLLRTPTKIIFQKGDKELLNEYLINNNLFHKGDKND